MSEHYFPCGHKVIPGHTCPVCVNSALLAALVAVEWGGGIESLGDYEDNRCPYCSALQHTGHAPDCPLDKALRDAKGE